MSQLGWLSRLSVFSGAHRSERRESVALELRSIEGIMSDKVEVKLFMIILLYHNFPYTYLPYTTTVGNFRRFDSYRPSTTTYLQWKPPRQLLHHHEFFQRNVSGYQVSRTSTCLLLHPMRSRQRKSLRKRGPVQGLFTSRGYPRE